MIDNTNKALNDLGNGAQKSAADLLKGMDLDAVKAELATLREQFDKVKGNVVNKASQVDGHVHTSPYGYVLGAFGLGVVAGGLLLSKRK